MVQRVLGERHAAGIEALERFAAEKEKAGKKQDEHREGDGSGLAHGGPADDEAEPQQRAEKEHADPGARVGDDQPRGEDAQRQRPADHRAGATLGDRGEDQRLGKQAGESEEIAHLVAVREGAEIPLADPERDRPATELRAEREQRKRSHARAKPRRHRAALAGRPLRGKQQPTPAKRGGEECGRLESHPRLRRMRARQRHAQLTGEQFAPRGLGKKRGRQEGDQRGDEQQNRAAREPFSGQPPRRGEEEKKTDGAEQDGLPPREVARARARREQGDGDERGERRRRGNGERRHEGLARRVLAISGGVLFHATAHGRRWRGADSPAARKHAQDFQ